VVNPGKGKTWLRPGRNASLGEGPRVDQKTQREEKGEKIRGQVRNERRLKPEGNGLCKGLIPAAGEGGVILKTNSEKIGEGTHKEKERLRVSWGAACRRKDFCRQG